MSHNMEKIKLTEKQYIEECQSYLQQSVKVSRLSVTTGTCHCDTGEDAMPW